MVTNWNLRQLIPEDGVSLGSARVIFEAPDGEISGPVTIRVMPEGQVTFAIDVEQYSIPPEYRNYLPPFLDGMTPEPGQNGKPYFVDRSTQKIPLLKQNYRWAAFVAPGP
jgi:hypothetical protein